MVYDITLYCIHVFLHVLYWYACASIQFQTNICIYIYIFVYCFTYLFFVYLLISLFIHLFIYTRKTLDKKRMRYLYRQIDGTAVDNEHTHTITGKPLG